MIIHITNEGIFVNAYELTTKFVGSSVMEALASYVLLPLARFAILTAAFARAEVHRHHTAVQLFHRSV